MNKNYFIYICKKYILNVLLIRPTSYLSGFYGDEGLPIVQAKITVLFEFWKFKFKVPIVSG